MIISNEIRDARQPVETSLKGLVYSFEEQGLLPQLPMETDFDQVSDALEVSWDRYTSYQMVFDENNPALGQCYSTARVIQLLFRDAEIVEGEVWTGNRIEKHFWNLLLIDGVERHIDLTWIQFPEASEVRKWRVRPRESLGDSQETVDRVNLLFERVMDYISRHKQQTRPSTIEEDIDKKLLSNALLRFEVKIAR